MCADSAQGELPSVSTSLLHQIQEMRPEAWARLVEVFSPIVYRWSRGAGLGEDESADVVQDVFVAVARNISKFERQKQQASFRSWLATITRNRIRDQFRRKGKTPEAFGGTEALQQLNDLPAKDHSSLENRSWDSDLEASVNLKSLDDRLPQRVLEIVKADCDPRTWQAFWMTTIKSRPAADVAAELQMEVASVYQAKSRILRRLRKRLKELPE